MPARVVQAGATVRVIVDPRSIADIEIVGGYLMVTYSDGSTGNAGFIGGGGTYIADLFNTAGTSSLRGVDVIGFVDAANIIDARLVALGY